MSSGTATPPPLPAESQMQAQAAQYEAFIEDRLRATRRQVKGVDVVVGLMTLSVGILVYLLAAVVIDHWLITGGLGFWGRLLLLIVMLGAAGWYAAVGIVPPVIYRINPIFAAQTIERSRPSLKNSLINFLLLRGHRRQLSPVVYQAMRRRAAADLSQVEIEAAVDRVHALRLGYVLVGTLVLCCLYLVLSPKSLLTSAARVIWPWADIKAPTRVTIQDVKPGDTVAYHGDQVTVSAEVDNVDKGESVLLYYSTTDGQIVGRAVAMTPKDAFRHQCKLPPGDLGLQQGVRYYLAAGDCKTRQFAIEVQTAPAITVETIRYDYPAYTGIADRTVRRQGDLRAVEGTQITIRATANREIKRAEIDFHCDGRRGQQMKPEGETATGRFRLRMNREDPLLPQYDCYQLRFTDRSGRPNRRPIRHRIEVLADLPPEVRFLSPQKEEVQLARDESLEIRVRAEDPDFALRKVVLRAEQDGRSLPLPPMLDRPRPQEPWADAFEATYLFEPARLGLQAGDRVRYWAEAEDNKHWDGLSDAAQPGPGRAETDVRWITIIGPESPQAPPQPPPDAQRSPQQGTDGNTGEQRPERRPDQDQSPPQQPPQDLGDQPPAEDQPPRPEERGDEPQQDPSAQQQTDQAPGTSPSNDAGGQPESGDAGENQDPTSEKPSEPINGETNAGDAFEEILQDRQRQQKQEDQDDNQSRNEQTGRQQTGSEQTGSEQTGSEQTGSEQTGSEQTGSEQTGSEQTGSEQTGNEQTGSEQTGNEKTGNEQSGNTPSGDEQSADQQQTSQPEAGPDSSGAGGPPQQNPDNTATGQKTDPSQKPGGGQGSKSRGPGQSSRQPPPGQGPEKPEAQGGDPQTGQSEPGAGKPSSDNSGSPVPQEASQPRRKQPGDAAQNPGQREQEPAKSPSTSPKDSDSQGDTSGDRSGGGEEGGGQQAHQSGTGTAGTHTAAEQGGSQARQQGDGETGPRGGDQVETDRQTGRSGTGQNGSRAGDRPRPGGEGPAKGPRQQDDSPGGTPQENPSDGGQPGSRVSKGPAAHGQGNPTVGGRPGELRDATPPPQTGEPGGDDPNLRYAAEQTDLALEHLKDQMGDEQSELLKRLGWSCEQAQRFVEKWERMKQTAAQQGAQGEAARRQRDEALRSLGLRPRGAEQRGSPSGADQLRNMREAGRFDPPAEWSEYFRAYTEGVARGGRR